MAVNIDLEDSDYEPFTPSVPKAVLASPASRSRQATEVPIDFVDGMPVIREVPKSELHPIKTQKCLAGMMVAVPIYAVVQTTRGHDFIEPHDIGQFVIWSTAASFVVFIYQFLFGSSTTRTEAAISNPGSVLAAADIPPRDTINNPISPFAITILRRLSICIALYICCVVVLNLEVLVFLPFLIKQRAYSFIDQELATPMIGPVFMMQMKQFGILVLDGFFTPWTLLGTQFPGLIR